MKRQGRYTHWQGRKMTDLSHIALKRGKLVLKIDCLEPSTKRCRGCKQCHTLPLKERAFSYPQCDLRLDCDHSAALNIQRAGASALGSGMVSRTSAGYRV